MAVLPVRRFGSPPRVPAGRRGGHRPAGPYPRVGGGPRGSAGRRPRHPPRGGNGALRSGFMAAPEQEVTRSPALYRKVAEDIKAAIAAGGYAAGTWLPSEHELAPRYSVSRGPIRQAFAALRADGIIASRRGARRVVVGGPRVQSFG